ncbi:UNVERIFIED_ORG: hypothetical protein J2W87_001412 [Pseudomonas putida]|nr:hypothetical protein [Pseudomonas putida]
MQKVARLGWAVAKVVLVGGCLVGSLSAANLYKEGSTPYRMFKVVEPVVGDTVTPVFVMGDAPTRFIADMDYVAVKAAGVKEETMRYYLTNLKPESKANGVAGCAMGGKVVPGNEVKSLTCAIVISSDQQIKTTSTIYHESIHCKNFAVLRDNREARLLAASFNPHPRNYLCFSSFFSNRGGGYRGVDAGSPVAALAPLAKKDAFL